MVDGQGEHFDRAYQLFSDQHYQEAEKVLNDVLVAEPENPWAHSLLALCLSYREEFRQATSEARAGVKHGSEIAFSHYALASILDDQDMFNEALISIRQAVRLDPDDALFHAQLAVIYLQQHRWNEAVESAGRGLVIDPGDTDCKTITDQALTMLGEISQNMEGLPDNLPSNPEAAKAYLNAGLASMSDGKRRIAMRHFCQALVLDPGLARAQQAIVSTVRAGNRVHGWTLAGLLWVSRLNPWFRAFLICFGLAAVVVLEGRILVNRMLVIDSIAVLAVIYLLWLPQALSHAVLLLSSIGRRAMTSEQKRQSAVLGFVLLLVLAWLILWGFLGSPVALLIAGSLGLLTVPLTLIYACPNGKGRAMMGVATVAQAALGALTVLASFYGQSGAVRGLAMAGMACALAATGLSRYLVRRRTPVESD